MASQCHLLSVPSSTSRLCISAASSASFSTNCNAGVNQVQFVVINSPIAMRDLLVLTSSVFLEP